VAKPSVRIAGVSCFGVALLFLLTYSLSSHSKANSNALLTASESAPEKESSGATETYHWLIDAPFPPPNDGIARFKHYGAQGDQYIIIVVYPLKFLTTDSSIAYRVTPDSLGMGMITILAEADRHGYEPMFVNTLNEGQHSYNFFPDGNGIGTHWGYGYGFSLTGSVVITLRKHK